MGCRSKPLAGNDGHEDSKDVDLTSKTREEAGIKRIKKNAKTMMTSRTRVEAKSTVDDLVHNCPKSLLTALKLPDTEKAIGPNKNAVAQDVSVECCGAQKLLQGANGPMQDFAAFLLAALSYTVFHGSSVRIVKSVTSHHPGKGLTLA